MTIDRRLLAGLSRDGAAGPAADHLAEQGADTPAVLRLFADGTLSREALAEWCAQAPDLKDGRGRRRAVLAVWLPEAEVLAENVVRSYGSHTPIPWLVPGYPRVTVHDYALEQVRGYLARGADAPGTLYEVRQEADAALDAFRRRVLRLFSEYHLDLYQYIDLRDFALEYDDFPHGLAAWIVTPPGLAALWGSRIGDRLRAAGFSDRLPIEASRSEVRRRVEFWQTQPAEYLLGPPPAGRQVGDMVPRDCATGPLPPVLVLSRPDRYGHYRTRHADGTVQAFQATGDYDAWPGSPPAAWPH